MSSFVPLDKSHKLTLRTLTLNKEGVKKERENIGGGQECGSRGGKIVFIKEIATFVRFCWRSSSFLFVYFQGPVVEKAKKKVLIDVLYGLLNCNSYF